MGGHLAAYAREARDLLDRCGRVHVNVLGHINLVAHPFLSRHARLSLTALKARVPRAVGLRLPSRLPIGRVESHILGLLDGANSFHCSP